jgi:hypothetical protein
MYTFKTHLSVKEAVESQLKRAYSPLSFPFSFFNSLSPSLTALSSYLSLQLCISRYPLLSRSLSFPFYLSFFTPLSPFCSLSPSLSPSPSLSLSVSLSSLLKLTLQSRRRCKATEQGRLLQCSSCLVMLTNQCLKLK